MSIIATWKMAYEGTLLARKALLEGKTLEEALITLIKDVELNENFHSVGYSGLPNEDGIVECDAAMMNGDNLHFGAVAGLRNIRSAVSVARTLMDRSYNNFLVGEGALKHAIAMGFKEEEMLTEEAKRRWVEERAKDPKVYKGHDTVCGLIAEEGRVIAGTSTSGLFMKKVGRVGDSPLVGPGLYADSDIGAAAATGVGEDIIKGTLSYAIVSLISEGLSVQDAAIKAVMDLDAKLRAKGEEPRDFSVIAVEKSGAWGAASNIAEFPFIVSEESGETSMYVARDFGRTIEKIK